MDGSPPGGLRRNTHPVPEALHALADGLPAALGDAALAAHVAECAACRAEVEQARHVTARLSALAAPPVDLLARVRARREAGERVLLPSMEVAEPWHPSAEALDMYADRTDDEDDGAEDAQDVAAHVAGCVTCGGAVERTRRVTAALSLASAPPADLLARVRARRAAGERVILPVIVSEAEAAADEAPRPAAGAPTPRAVHARRRAATPGRWRIASLGAVAALLLVTVRFAPGWRAGAGDEGAPVTPMRVAPQPTPSAGAPVPATGPLVPPAPVGPAPAPPAPATPRVPDRLRSVPAVEGTPATPAVGTAAPDPGSAPSAPEARVRAAGAAISAALAGVPAEAFAPAQAAALDSIARVLAADPGRRATVRYTDPAFAHTSPSVDVANRVADYLLLRGVAAERVSTVRVAALGGFGGRAPADAVEVVVDPPAGPP